MAQYKSLIHNSAKVVDCCELLLNELVASYFYPGNVCGCCLFFYANVTEKGDGGGRSGAHVRRGSIL